MFAFVILILFWVLFGIGTFGECVKGVLKHTGQIWPYFPLKDGGLWTILDGGKLWKNSGSNQKTEIRRADFE